MIRKLRATWGKIKVCIDGAIILSSTTLFPKSWEEAMVGKIVYAVEDEMHKPCTSLQKQWEMKMQ